MNASRLGAGERIAGSSAVVLLVVMSFGWFQLEGITAESQVGGVAAGSFEVTGDQLEAAAESSGESTSASAWGAFGLIDLVLLAAALAGLTLAVLALTARGRGVAAGVGAIAAVLGALATALILFRLVSPPDLIDAFGSIPGDFGVKVETDVGPKIPAFIGLAAAFGVAFGGWRALQASAPARD